MTPRRAPAPETHAVRASAALLALLFSSVPVAHAQTILPAESDSLLSRPLFAPDRRPADQPTPAIENHDPDLTGIVLHQEERRALFAAPASGLPAPALSIGDTIDNWRVASITSDTVILEKAGQTLSLHPRFGPATTDGTAPVPDTTPLQSALPTRRPAPGPMSVQH